MCSPASLKGIELGNPVLPSPSFCFVSGLNYSPSVCLGLDLALQWQEACEVLALPTFL